jgi:5'-3' exonuclease
MGVPAFYRWLAEKYPKTIVDCVEAEAPPLPDGSSDFGAVDWTGPGLNNGGQEVDCLYLDMNGVIHPCARPEEGPPITSEAQIFRNIEKYIDRLLAAVRPRRLLYMAVDGPAPRAKMNQQRSRRFKAAKDSAETEAAGEVLRAEWKGRGLQPPPKKDPATSFHFDSNVITPGTHYLCCATGCLLTCLLLTTCCLRPAACGLRPAACGLRPAACCCRVCCAAG